MKRSWVNLLKEVSLIKATKKTYSYAGYCAKYWDVLKMDVWIPESPRADHACVIALHGGGFIEGSRDDEWSVKAAETLTNRGFMVVCPDYRLGMKNEEIVKENSSLLKLHNILEYCVELVVEDLINVVDYLLSRDDLQINRHKVILVCSSAGAIAALQLEYYRVNQMLRPNQLFNYWQPAAIVAYSGAVIANHFDFGYKWPGIAPTLLFHGLDDRIVEPGRKICSLKNSFYGSVKLYEAMTSKWPMSTPLCWLFRVEDAWHEVSLLLPETIDLFCAFVNEALNYGRSRMNAIIRGQQVEPLDWTKKSFLELLKDKTR